MEISNDVYGGRINQVYLKTLSKGNIRSGSTDQIYNHYTKLTSFGLIPTLRDNRTSFWVKSCRDTCILLSDTETLLSDVFYEICFAQINRMLNIWRGNADGSTNEMKSMMKTSLLNCTGGFSNIWVLWNDGQIHIGVDSEIGEENSLIQSTDNQPFDIRGIGIITTFSIDGIWKMDIQANPTGYFCGVSNTRAPITFLSVSTQRIRTYCALECDRSDDCLGFNYRTTGTENCEIIDGAQLVVTESANGWKFYSKCLQDKNICLACRVN
ncbi:Hypothetical predicted protein [Mytilus galloprovincialis]|uniref:Farnesoic acid O-methyl transferase domain-containing protein n=1 Tax=Mytilus galloprovincialis TaxID=29158 RepID=A0A8B6EA27_MYTGA|nr:Hypothetical predicted protein [Mytilus galloprovincialis]